MKIVILKNNLKDGLLAVQQAVAINPSNLPVLKNVLIKTIGNKVKIATTNLELAATKLVSGKIVEEGGLTIPFNTLYNIINNTNSEKINLERNNNNLIFKTDNYEARIQGIKEEEFPIIPPIKTDNYLEINPVIFKKAVGKVINAAQISEIKPEISGLLFDYQITLLKLVATDTFRLAEKIINASQFNSNFNYSFKVIIPLVTINEIIKVINNESPLKIYISDNQILFQSGDLEVISRLIDGNYPEYEQIVPKNFKTELIIDRDHLNSAVRLVSTFSGRANEVNLSLKNDKVMEVYITNQFLGENNYLIPIKVNGDSFNEITFNWRYLNDGLKTIDSNNLVLGVNDSAKPVIIKSADDNSHFYILMPIKN